MPAHGLVHHPDAVAEADAAMELDHGRTFGSAGIAVGDANRNRFLQAHDVVEIRELLECIEKSLLDGPRIAEHVRDAVGQKLFDHCKATGSVSHVSHSSMSIDVTGSPHRLRAASRYHPQRRRPLSKTSIIFSPTRLAS